MEVPVDTVNSWIKIYSKEYLKSIEREKTVENPESIKTDTIDGTYTSAGRDVIGKKSLWSHYRWPRQKTGLTYSHCQRWDFRTCGSDFKTFKGFRRLSRAYNLRLYPYSSWCNKAGLWENVIQIDLFHVIQLLNNGIKADLLKYREKRFDAERRELCSLRNWVNSIQKIVNDVRDFSIALRIIGKLPEVKSTHKSS